LGFEVEVAIERHGPGGGQPDILGTKDQLVDRHHAGIDVIFHLGLIEMKLLQLLDLEQLPQGDEQAVLPHLTVAQNDFPPAGKCIRIRCRAARVEMALELSRHRP
jgi:hypothetical protein